MSVKNLAKINKNHFKDVNLSIFLLSIIFGISSWVVFSGIMAETPLLIKKLPEEWKIPSMINLFSQIAQIGPILLFLMKCKCVSCLHNNFAKKLRKFTVSDRVIIYCLYAIGITAGCCLALFWNKTVVILGEMKSVYFLTCVYFLAILDCTCTIAFLTYMGSFKGDYIPGLYIGEGISSLLPSVFALLQGVDDDDDGQIECKNSNSSLVKNLTLNSSVKQIRFSVSTYFWLLESTIIISFIAFLILEFWPSFQKEKIKSKKENVSKEFRNLKNYQVRLDEIVTESLINDVKVYKVKSNKKLDESLLLIAISLVSFILYGFLQSLSSYSALPYSNYIMHLCVNLSLIVQPISSLIATFYEIKTTKNIWIFLNAAILFSSYIFISAILSPCPPLVNHWIGGYLMVFAWVLTCALLMYLRCCITSALKKNHGQKSLIWCGLLTQFGQFLGGISISLIIHFTNFFKQANPCDENFSCKF